MNGLKSISREELRDVLALLASVEEQFADAPHRSAVAGIRHIEEARDVLCEALPGGFFTHCEACELPIGCDEIHATDPEGGATLCGDCLARYEQPAPADPTT